MKYRETIQSDALYGKVAARYDKTFERAILAEGRLTRIVQEYMNQRQVVDIACGNGRWLDRFAPVSYVGVDLNPAMLQRARLRYPTATFIEADMTELPFPDKSFEGAVSLFGAMGHLPPPGQLKLFRETHRVLCRDGIAIFTNGNQWSPFNLPTTLKRNRIKIEGVRLKVHSDTPKTLRQRVVVAGFELLEMSSYDFSYVPMAPMQLSACLLNRDYERSYATLMELFEHCRHIPNLQWFGKQLVAVCRKLQ
jgi:SAM-dependent methyltransferase